MYGWGLYFAGRRAVAEWYRDKLSNEVPLINGQRAGEYAIFKTNSWATAQWKNLWASYIQDGDLDAAKADVVADLKYRLRHEDSVKEKRAIEETIAFIQGINSVELQSSGNIYQVDIPEDSEL